MVHLDFPFSHFIFQPLFEVECRCQHSCASSHFHVIRCSEIDVPNNFNNLTSLSSVGPRCEVYAVFMYFFLLCIVLHRSLFDAWCGILFLTHFHDSCLVWCIIICVMYLLSWFIMLCFEIPLLYANGILMLSSCMFALRYLLWHVVRMLIMHEFYVILIGVLFDWEFLQWNISWSHSCVRAFSLYDSDTTS